MRVTRIVATVVVKAPELVARHAFVKGTIGVPFAIRYSSHKTNRLFLAGSTPRGCCRSCVKVDSIDGDHLVDSYFTVSYFTNTSMAIQLTLTVDGSRV